MAKCPFCDHFNRTDATECEKCRAPLTTNVPKRPDDGPQAEQPIPVPTPEPGSLEADILSLIKGQKKIEAIKLYRERTRVGLKEAKDFVEALAAKHGINPNSGCGGVVLLMLTLGATAAAAACTLIL